MSDVNTADAHWSDKYRRRYREAKSWLYLKWHGFYWGLLWATKLAKPYSKFMCKHNWYGSFPDGRCKYCGDKHL